MTFSYLADRLFDKYRKACLLVGIIVLSSQAVVADSVSFDFDIEGFGNSAGTVFDQGFFLGEVISIDSVSIELTHSFAADIDFTMQAPDGQTFNFTSDLGGDRDLGNGDSDLAGTALYSFVEFADDDLGQAAGNPIPSGTYKALEWGVGAWSPGNWQITLVDDGGGDDGAVGSVVVNFTTPAIPEPTSGVLLTAIVLGLGCRRKK